MPSFTLTNTTAVITTQTLSLANQTGFVGTVASLVTAAISAVSIDSTAGGCFLVNNGAIVSDFRDVLAHASFRLINTGLMACEGNAIEQDISSSTLTSTTIQNSGSILSSLGTAISINESGARISNDGFIGGFEVAIRVGTAGAADVTEIVNSGTIAAALDIGSAIMAASALRLINTGEILGNVLGSGQNDEIDNRAGMITGQIILGDGQNWFRGGVQDDEVRSGSGADTLLGGAGDDKLISDGGFDQIFGGVGDDHLATLDGRTTLSGGLGDDSIFGGISRDALSGGGGDDLLQGNRGVDMMSGGLGADTFRFIKSNEIGLGAGADVITDFLTGTDRIDLSGLTGRLDFVGSGQFTGGGTASVGFVRVDLDLMLRTDADGDGAEDATIVLLHANRVSVDDFLL